MVNAMLFRLPFVLIAVFAEYDFQLRNWVMIIIESSSFVGEGSQPRLNQINFSLLFLDKISY